MVLIAVVLFFAGLYGVIRGKVAGPINTRGKSALLILASFVFEIIRGVGSSTPPATPPTVQAPQKAPVDAAPVSAPAPAPKPPKPDHSNLKMGSTVKVGDLEITVNSARIANSYDGKAILADVTIKNTGSTQQPVSSLLSWEMRDAEGYKLDITIGVDDQRGGLDGTIGAGSQMRGEIAYKLKNAKGDTMELIYSEPFDSTQYIWKVPVNG